MELDSDWRRICGGVGLGLAADMWWWYMAAVMKMVRRQRDNL